MDTEDAEGAQARERGASAHERSESRPPSERRARAALKSEKRRASGPGALSKDTLYRPKHKVRFVTAASLFDGHDASINIIRRLLQDRGVEVIHLGHNRSVSEIVSAAIQEDAHAIAVSSYQGGHNEFFRYLVDLLRERGAAHVRVFGGGGGVIVPREIRELESYGVTRIYSPEDGRVLGLAGMIDDMVRSADFALPPIAAGDLRLDPGAVG
jgi:methylmalonyl-CoA mutase cobalamin-binding domain/chain